MKTFIAHSSSDKKEISEALDYISGRVADFNPLMLGDGGVFWKREAKRKIKKAQVVLHFAGKQSHQSKYIGWELKTAIKLNKQIIIVKLNEDNTLHPVLMKVDKFSNRPCNYGKIKTVDEFIRLANNYIYDEYELFNNINDTATLFEQYKLFLDTSERLVERRQKVSNLYITANTVLISIIGTLIAVGINAEYLKVICATISLIGIILGISWINIIDSYGNLNSSKMKIISMIERKLPASLFDTEWEILSDKLNTKQYVSFTEIEKKIPKIFMVVYSVTIIAMVLSILLA